MPRDRIDADELITGSSFISISGGGRVGALQGPRSRVKQAKGSRTQLVGSRSGAVLRQPMKASQRITIVVTVEFEQGTASAEFAADSLPFFGEF